MTRLKAQNKELALRPPIEEFAACHFGWRPPKDVAGNTDASEYLESDLPEFEP
jgi:hypothetical protein